MRLDPIDLQVVTGALRAACEEMGAVLVRSAHSANIKERRDCSTGLFDAAGRDGHAGRAHPRPPRRDAGRGGARCSTRTTPPGARGSSTTRSRRHPPARHHGHHAGDRRRRRPARLRRQPRPPRRRRRARPGSMPADSTTLDEEGVVIAPRLLDDARDGRAQRAACASPTQRRADLRAQLAANRLGAQRMRELAARLGTDALREATRAVLDYAERRTRACIAALPDGRERRAMCSRASTATSSCGCGAHRRRRPPRPRLRRQRAAARRQPQLPARGDALARRTSPCRVLTDPDVPPSAGAYRADRASARPRARCSTRPPDGRRRRGRQRRDVAAASRTSCSPPSAARSARAR